MLEELTLNGSLWPSMGLDLVGAFPITVGQNQDLFVDFKLLHQVDRDHDPKGMLG